MTKLIGVQCSQDKSYDKFIEMLSEKNNIWNVNNNLLTLLFFTDSKEDETLLEWIIRKININDSDFRFDFVVIQNLAKEDIICDEVESFFISLDLDKFINEYRLEKEDKKYDVIMSINNEDHVNKVIKILSK